MEKKRNPRVVSKGSSMNLEIGKTYKIDPSYKKSVEEIEIFYDGDKRYLSVNTLWRWGTYIITPTSEEEIEWLNAGLTEGGLCVTDFEEWELDNTLDGVSVELSFSGDGWESEEQKEAIEEDYFENWDLESHNFLPEDIEIYIHEPITIEEWRGYGV